MQFSVGDCLPEAEENDEGEVGGAKDVSPRVNLP